MERKKLFEKPIVRKDGTTVWLNFLKPADEGSDKWFEQSVQVGEVLAVGSRVENIRPGDFAIMDYTVDKTAEHVLWENEEEKCMRVLAVSTFKKERFVIPANRRTPHPSIIWNKDDADELSLVIGVVRDGEIHPVYPYMFLDYEGIDEEWKQRDDSVIFTRQIVAPVVNRTVAFVSHKSEYKQGQVLSFDFADLFERMFEGKRFDIGWEHIVLGEPDAITEGNQIKQYS